jgi:hypothetical protein
MGETYEILLRKGETPDKKKIEIRKEGEVIKEIRREACEVDAMKIKHIQGAMKTKHIQGEVVHFKEIDNTNDLVKFVVELRRLGLDSCADEVSKWIGQMGGRGVDE